jgi:hypothetical protein
MIRAFLSQAGRVRSFIHELGRRVLGESAVHEDATSPRAGTRSRAATTYRAGQGAILTQSLSFGLHTSAERIRDPLVSVLGRVLVDERRPIAVVPHPCFEIGQARP